MRENKYTSKFPVFETPVDLLVHYDPDFLNEIYSLYPWQIEILMEFSLGKWHRDNNKDIIRMAVAAANGSGKSQFVLAPAIAWMAVAFENSLSYITSSSASQLDTQTERFLDGLALKMNVAHEKEYGGMPVWKIVKRKKQFLPNDSYIDLFATDEPNKAEGKHPLNPVGEFAIFLDEGKSVEEDIYHAIERCTGSTRRLDVSSTGQCQGHFFNVMTKPELGWWTRKITYKQCPHISDHEYNQQVLKYGPNDPLIKSIFFSEFSDIGTTLVCRRETLNECERKFNQPVLFTKRRAGLDLSGGGDEICLSIWEGNVMIAQEYGRFYDTAQGVREIIHWCESWKLEANQVWVEYDGFNKPMVGNLRDRGWDFNTVLANSSAIDKARYGNKMTELWFKVKRYIEEGVIKIIPDEVLRNQISNRYYRRKLNSDQIILEPKVEAKAKGRPSPDRADAMMYAWTICPGIEQFLKDHINKVPEIIKKGIGERMNGEKAEEFIDDVMYGTKRFFSGSGQKRKLLFNSLSSLKPKVAEESIDYKF